MGIEKHGLAGNLFRLRVTWLSLLGKMNKRLP